MLTQYNIRNIKLAIFDLDNTILKIDSDYEMVNYLIDKNFILEKYRKINKDYFNSTNKPRMTQPKLGVVPKELGIKGGAGPKGKFLKRI